MCRMQDCVCVSKLVVKQLWKYCPEVATYFAEDACLYNMTAAMLEERLSEVQSRSRPPSPSHGTSLTPPSATSPSMLFGGNPVFVAENPLSNLCDALRLWFATSQVGGQ